MSGWMNTKMRLGGIWLDSGRQDSVKSDIRVLDADCEFKDEAFRVPLAFGSGVIDTITSFTVRVEVENRIGNRATGVGNVLLSDLWAFLAHNVSHESKDTAMREVGRSYATKISGYQEYAHPLDIYLEAIGDLKATASQVEAELGLESPIPWLAAKLCASPIDAAIHDAFGRVNGISSYDGYGPEFMSKDLGAYLGPEFKGRYLEDYVKKSYEPYIPVFHLVGGKDRLRQSEITASDPKDGFPVSLDEWIKRDGVFCFKIKLRGNDLAWDVQRIVDINEVVKENIEFMGTSDAPAGSARFYYSLDTNEMCESPEYMVELLEKVRAHSPEAFQGILYVEQPTERDLDAHRFDMKKLAALKPVLIDESVTDLESIDTAHDLGWSGVALKTCKGQSFTLLSLAKCRNLGMMYSVQDLTNPGFSLVQSVGLASRIWPVKGVEYNSRQYIPLADREIQMTHEDVFEVRKGHVGTASLDALGLGYRCG